MLHITWDERKSASNLAKHGLDFHTASCVFDDPLHVSRLERVADGEERWQTIGKVGPVTLILVAHTYHDQAGCERIRLISARKATAHERRRYEEHR